MSTTIPLEIVLDAERLSSPEALAELQAKLADFAPILAKVGEAIEEGLLANFNSEGEGSWAALKDSTRRQKAHDGFPDASEYRSGRLKAAVTQHDAPGHIFTINENSVTVGVDTAVVRYAGIQNDGSVKHGLPGRILVQVGPGCLAEIVTIITDWLGGGDAVRVYVNE